MLKLEHGAKQLNRSEDRLSQLGLGLASSWTVKSQCAGHTQISYVGISGLEPGISHF